VLLRLFDLSQGSPLVALELGHVLVEQGLPDVGDELPLPELVDELFSHRVGSLGPEVRRALLAVALTGGLPRLDLASLVGPLVIDDAIATGVLVRVGSRVRASHPLLGAAARRLSSAVERHELHLALADTLGDETTRARHLALAASVADDELADRIATAGERALARGAIHDAVELAEHALRLTRPAAAVYEERMFTLVHRLKVAGETARVRELLEARVAGLPPGTARARALLTLSDSGERLSEMEAYVDAALVECGDDPELRSAALATKALIYGIVRMEKLEAAETWARESLELARSVGVEARRRSVHALAWIDVMRGRPLERLGAEFDALPSGASLYESAIDRPAGIRAMVRGDLRESRAVFERLRSLAGERGEALSASIMHRQLCEIELRAGDTRVAERHLDQWGEWTLPDDEHEQVVGPARCRALLGAIKGDAEQARAWAAKAIEAARAIENFREETEARRALGLAALFVHDHRSAVEELQPLWRHAERELIDDPGVFPVAPDLVESLVQLGQLDDARTVAAKLERAADAQAHPWALAGARRCLALIQLASGDTGAAEEDLADAAVEYARLGLRFDAARTLLILGRARRRRRKWGAAREALEASLSTFADLGASGWAGEARAELSRLGARRPTPQGTLSNAEREVAELAAKGRSNKAIAAELHVTINTVEKHLSHAYAKLGVHSRGQLAPHLASAD
jgi:DNA-binding CsgD family transcriptional regulator